VCGFEDGGTLVGKGRHKHGHTTKTTKSPTYNSWWHMLARCRNPNMPYYDKYGGRGIKVCERWRSFEAFLADMGERPFGMTLDRLDNEGDYSPDNCRWATRATQQQNRRCNKITTESAAHIRKLVLEAGLTRVEVARRYSVHVSTIENIVAGRAWKSAG